MIISKCIDEKHIYTAWRENGERKFKLEAHEPYFFIEDDEFEFENYTVKKYISRSFRYEQGDWVSLKGKPLKKVVVEQATDIYKARKMWNKTYEADVPFGFRYAIDNLNELPEFKLRKWYWDMEWQQGGEHHDKITVIVAYDNYDETYYQWAWFPNYEGEEYLFFDNEKEMIESFIRVMVEKDPDMLIAWFGLKFDLPKLLERCCALGINPMLMSPINRIDGVKKTGNGFTFSKAESGFSPIQQPLGGRITLNLDLAFERQWNDSQRGTLPSMSLEFVSQTLFGEGKSKETIFEDPNEFYRRGWLEDTEAYLKYALIDVELLVRIDETNFCSEAIIALQRLLVAPFEACFYASHMGSIYFMRNADWICKTGSKVDKRETYDGAMIYDPLSEGTNGLHLNVAAFDFAGLYPSMMIARNISFETKSEEPTEFAVNIATPRDFSPVIRKHMLYYKTDKLGLLPRAVLELKELRNEYKRLMREAREAGNDSEVVKWNNNQMAVKRLMASFYGIVAFQGFGWADVNLAASITASAREAIRLAAFKAKEMKE
jgi:DNA polymerase elongation subunit (family B)